MCHQSVGLIAREIEGRAIPTVGLSSALTITQASRQPRAVHLDFPLGHTAGKAHDTAMQEDVVTRALSFLYQAEGPESVLELGYRWTDSDAWKDTVMRDQIEVDGKLVELDDRVERHGTPQYQSEADEVAANAEPECQSCVFLTA